MPNNLNSNNLFERKNYLSLSEFETFYELPESNPLMIVDASCKIIFSNNAFKNIFNLPEVHTFFDLSSEPDLSYLLIVLTGSSYNNFHFDLFFSPEQNLKNYNFNVEAERIFIESSEYFVIIFKSLEEKTKLEERINSLHKALEYGNIPVLITDGEGKIIYTTNSFEKILKAEIETIYNCSISDALSFYLTKEEKHRLEESIEALRIWSKTISFTDTDKNVLYLELKLNPIFRTGEENLRFILTANDITNYVLKHQIIKKSERRLKSIINNISDLLFIFKEKKGELLFENANDNFCNIFSVDKNKDLKKDINSVLEENLLKQLKASLQKYDYQNNYYAEFNYTSPQQREYVVKITSVDDKVENEKVFIVSMQDVTDEMMYQSQLKKAYEKEINLNKLKTALLENMSHEIRTPFNAIAGYSEIIEESVAMKDYNTILELVTAFKDVLGRVLNLFNNIVEVSQIESGEVELEFVNLNCNQVLKAIYNKKIEEAQSKRINFQLKLEDSELNIKTDWFKLEKIILSLVENALKYTDKGEVVIQSKTIQNTVEIFITDTGRGIEPNEIKKLLEPFVQEEEAYVRSYEGAGLGLTIAYKLTNMLGGKFDIQSIKNEGTTVILTFPLTNEELIEN